MKRIVIISLLIIYSQISFSQVKEVLISTYLGNEQRNYYGNEAPEKLDLIWKL